MAEDLKRTPLHAAHVAAGGKMVPFAGFEMPVQYATGLLEEHRAVRERAGLFDVSHMGEIVFRGPQALAAVQALVSNDVGAAADGQAQYAALCNAQGGIVDDVVVYRRSADDLLVCVNASNRAKDFEWVAAHSPKGAAVDEGDDYAQLALQGPRAAAIVAALGPRDLQSIGTYRFREDVVAGRKVLLARTGYTGEDGFELFCKPSDATALWEALLEAGRADGVIPCGLGARNSLRTEMKYCLYGNDIDDGTTPLEAGLGWITKLNKTGGFMGAEALRAQKERGLSRKLVGFELTERGIPRHGYPVFAPGPAGAADAGQVTSGTLSPTLGKPIGMAYVPLASTAPGSPLEVEIRGRRLPAVVVETPFYKPAQRR